VRLTMATVSPIANAAVVISPPSSVNNEKLKFNKKVLTGLGVSRLFLARTWSMLKLLCLIILFIHKFYQWFMFSSCIWLYGVWQMFRSYSAVSRNVQLLTNHPHITDSIRDWKHHLCKLGDQQWIIRYILIH